MNKNSCNVLFTSNEFHHCTPINSLVKLDDSLPQPRQPESKTNEDSSRSERTKTSSTRIDLRKPLSKLLQDFSISDNEKMRGVDPEVLYSICIASKRITRKNERKERLTTLKNSIFGGNTKTIEPTSGYKHGEDSSSVPNSDLEYDLIVNCPLIWPNLNTNGRRFSVSERHKKDRLMVVNACRNYRQLQNINQHF